jgi:hypothetical protein
LNGARTQEKELQKIAPVQRQFVNLPLGDHLTHRGIFRIHGDRRRLHVDGFSDFAHGKFQIDADHLIHPKCDT